MLKPGISTCLEVTYPACRFMSRQIYTWAANSDFAVPFKDPPDITLLVQYSDYAESASLQEVVDPESDRFAGIEGQLMVPTWRPDSSGTGE